MPEFDHDRELQARETEKRVFLGVALGLIVLLLVPWRGGDEVPAYRTVVIDAPPPIIDVMPPPELPPPPEPADLPDVEAPIILPGEREIDLRPEEHEEPEVESLPAPALEPRAHFPRPPPPASGEAGPVREGQAGLEKPELIEAPSPGFPRACLVTSRGGQVVIEILIGRDGRVRSARLLKGAACEALNEAALAAVRERLYRPGRLEGREVDVLSVIKVDFHLR